MGGARDDYFDRILKSGATFLARWQGAAAEMWELTRSHQTFTIVLTRTETSGNLVLSCGPVRIRGPVRWERAHISIARMLLPDGIEEGFRVVDEQADLEILCVGLEIRENVKLY